MQFDAALQHVLQGHLPRGFPEATPLVCMTKDPQPAVGRRLPAAGSDPVAVAGRFAPFGP